MFVLYIDFESKKDRTGSKKEEIIINRGKVLAGNRLIHRLVHLKGIIAMLGLQKTGNRALPFRKVKFIRFPGYLLVLLWLSVNPIYTSQAQPSFNKNFQDARFTSLTINNWLTQNFDSSIHQDQLIESASLDSFSPAKNRFAYNLSAQNDAERSDQEAVMKLNIAKPWWMLPWAYVVFLLFLISFVFGIRHYELSRVRMRERMKKADFETGKLKELDTLKSQFFANISHEFRTPLTLIKGPLEDILEDYKKPPALETLKMMHSNTERLLRLINQLLDLSKLESGQFTIKVTRGDITGFLRGLVMSFSSMVEQKNQKLKFIEASTVKSPELKNNFYFDRDVVEKIINNLLSNAIKFTPEHGKITVTTCLTKSRNTKIIFEITIKDTGIGIPHDKLPHIYDRFYQVDQTLKREHEGSGVGLAYVKELVKAHKGSISVMSNPGEGTVFRLRFPIGSEYYTHGEIIMQDPDVTFAEVKSYKQDSSRRPEALKQEQHYSKKDKEVILIVEDHPDVRKYICDNLKKEYSVLEASNGKEGFRIADEAIPDLIISDVMMPGMDGFEYCANVKSNEKTSHIPVILLTAKSEKKDLIQGLETGADDYLTKPFNTKELRARVKNLIENRRYMREKFEITSVIKPGEISVTSRDRSFMEKLVDMIEKNINSENFSVEDLAREVEMSQSQLHRKLKALINQSASQFIRSAKMHRAKELLEKDAGNIADIAYMVGFSDPGYFTKTYRAFFGILPSETRRKNEQ